MTDRLNEQSVTAAVSTPDDWQRADGVFHAEPQEEKGKRNRQRRGAHTPTCSHVHLTPSPTAWQSEHPTWRSLHSCWQ